MNSFNYLFCYFLILGLRFDTFSQTISLKSPSNFTPHHYFIAQVLDRRDYPNTIGNIIDSSQTLKPIKLAETLPKSLSNAWDFPKNKTSFLYPIIATIKTFRIAETANKNEKIKGKIIMVFNFSWKRDSTEIQLTTYNGGVQYARPRLYSLDYELSISKQANNALVYLNEWMKQNLDKNSVLARCIRVIPQPNYVTNTPNSDTVFHAERPLVWADFPERKTSPSGSHHSVNVRFAASIFSNFLYEAPTRIKNGCIEIDFRVKVFMQKSMSWVLPTAKDTYSLNHEQTHFNITRLVAERFKSHIVGQDLSVDYYDSQMQLAFLDFYRDMTNLQKQYDEETQHGINTAAQAQWEQKIEKALAVFN